MPAARYWRMVGMRAHGRADVELSEVKFYGGGAADPDYAFISTLLHGNGTNGSTTFTDSGPGARTFTPSGSVSISTAQSKFGGASMLFAGGQISTPQNDAFAFETGDFCIEFWAWKSADGAQGFDTLFDTSGNGSGNGGYFIELSGTRGLQFVVNGSFVLSHIFNPNDSAWHHYALSRSGATVRFFIDGTQVATSTSSASVPANAAATLGRVAGSYAFAGYVDDFRVTKGVARYTSNFTPPTVAFPDSAVSGSELIANPDTATLTTTAVSGSASALLDDNLTTTVRFDPSANGTALVFDFGASRTPLLTALRLGSGSSESLFLSRCDLQSSPDGDAWTQELSLGQYPWPGANALTADPTAGGSTFEPIPTRAINAHDDLPLFREDIAGATSSRAMSGQQTVRDMFNAGRGFIESTVKQDATPTDIPLARRVRLHRDRDGLQVAETWSRGSDGVYRFDEIDEREKYHVISFDHTGNFRAVIADNLTPEVAP